MTRAAHAGRAGGLTFALGLGALGVGFAIATGTAASAWASPADPASDSASGDSTAHATARGKHVPAIPKSASSRTNSTAPAATVRTAASTPVALVRTPDVAPAPVAAQQAATTFRPRQGRVSVPLDQRQTTYTILPSIPPGLPLVTVPWVKQVNGSGSFTANSIYNLNNADQYDWNKLTGISFSIPGDVNSSMVAWRYNVPDQVFEIAPFFNVNKARILPQQSEIITVPIGDTYGFNVDYDGITISYGDQAVFKATPVGLTPNFWTSYRVSVWFGGTSLPPNLIQLRMRIN